MAAAVLLPAQAPFPLSAHHRFVGDSPGLLDLLIAASARAPLVSAPAQLRERQLVPYFGDTSSPAPSSPAPGRPGASSPAARGHAVHKTKDTRVAKPPKPASKPPRAPTTTTTAATTPKYAGWGTSPAPELLPQPSLKLLQRA